MKWRRTLLYCISSTTLACHDPGPTRTPETPWSIPTEYAIDDYPQEALSDLPELLADYGFKVEKSDKPNLYVFVLSKIVTMNDLRNVQDRLLQWSREHKKPLKLRVAQMIYASVNASVDTSVALNGDATEGADVEVDLGDKPAMEPPNIGGHWTLLVNDDEQDAIRLRRGGWVYVKTTKNGAAQYFRKTLTGKGFEYLTVDQLPADSPLRNDSSSHPDSSGQTDAASSGSSADTPAVHSEEVPPDAPSN
jgi:hypothetical protein